MLKKIFKDYSSKLIYQDNEFFAVAILNGLVYLFLFLPIKISTCK